MARFEKSIDVSRNNGCWEWRGYVCKQTGYGKLYDSKTKKQDWVHRIAYRFFKSDIPMGLQIDHLCRNRACVNPDHLEAVTAKENKLRGISPPALRARSITCSYGHPWVEENIYRCNLKKNVRICWTCKKAREKKVRSKDSFKEKRRLQHKKAPKILHKCRFCNIEFCGRKNKEYCSSSCRVKSCRERKFPKMKENMEVHDDR